MGGPGGQRRAPMWRCRRVSTDILFAGIAVSEIAAALAWYQLLFERQPDLVAQPEEVLGHVAESG